MSQGFNDNPEHEPITVDHSPTRISTYAAVTAAVVAGLTSAPFAVLTIPLGFAGIAAVAAGLLVVESRKWVSLGVGSLLLGVFVSGGFGTPVEFLLVSTIAAILSWDLGHYAISLGEQVGSHSRTERVEIIHGAFTTLVGMVAAALGYGFFVTAGTGKSVASLSLLIVGIVCLLWAIRT
jgi:hypothetical protein